MNEPILFYRVGDPYGSFSNFSPHPLRIDELSWPTSEHYFQASKFLDEEYREQIRATPSPMEAAKLGRDRGHPLREDWEKVKDDVMRRAVRAKVMQHADVRELLLETGDAEIVEHTSNDSYWADGGDGSGKNMLGKILMEIRDSLRNDPAMAELSSPMLPPWLQHPDLERFSIGWRMGTGEDYMIDWENWWSQLSDEAKARYQELYPPPQIWESFYDS